jgi:flagellar biosynthesis protein FlhF
LQMELRKFQASSLQGALESVKRELGSDAIVVETHKHESLEGVAPSPVFEVTARPNGNSDVSDLQRLTQELSNLRHIVEGLQLGHDELRTTRDLPILEDSSLYDVFYDLILQGVEKSLIAKVIAKISTNKTASLNLQQRALECLLDHVELKSIYSGMSTAGSGPTVFSFIGTTGVGKTTTVAKIAARALDRKIRVGLISLQMGESSAFDQLAAIARLLNVPFRSVRSKEDLEISLRDFHTYDVILLDTSGLIYRNPESMEQLRGILSAVPRLKTLFLMSATTRDSEMVQMARRHQVLNPAGIIFTKIDEASFYGMMVSLPYRVGLPLFGYTTGQNIPGDYQEASRSALIDLLSGSC